MAPPSPTAPATPPTSLGAVTDPGRHAADRHHDADGVVGDDVGHRHHRRLRRPRRRQDCHADGHHERGGDGQHSGGTPTLTLNDGGTATYSGGSGTSALTFSYTVAAGQNTADLAVTAFNANGGTITNGAGNAATMTGAVTNPAGTLQIDTTTPTVSSVTASGTGITAGSGDLGAGKTVTLTVAMSEAVTVSTSGGTPTLTLNDGGTATYSGGSGTERADLQLHGCGRAEHRRPGGDGLQRQWRHDHQRRRQCRRP